MQRTKQLQAPWAWNQKALKQLKRRLYVNDRIGISIGSLLPWSAFPLWDFLAKSFAVPIAAAMTKQIGAAFWQVLPFKGVTAAALEKAGIPVRYAELAWNGTTLWRHLRGEEGNAGIPSMWQDVLLFPKPQVSRVRTTRILMEPGIWYVTHTIPESNESWPGLVEIHPDLDMTTKALEFAASSCLITRKPYVMDTRHLRRNKRSGESSPLEPWQEALEKLLPLSQALHVQPLNGKEFQRTLDGYSTDLWTILHYLNGRFEGNFIIEVPPTVLGTGTMASPRKMIKELRWVKNLIEETAL